MPEMILPDGMEFIPALTWVYMFFPESEEQRLKFLTGVDTASATLPVATGHAEASSLSPEQRRALALGPNIQSTYADVFGTLDEYGFFSGVILLHVLALATHAPELASVSRVIDLIRSKMNGKKVTREHLMRRWSAYKSVSHFYAAYLVDGGYRFDAERAYGYSTPITDFADGPRIASETAYDATSKILESNNAEEFALTEANLRWLAIAEALRQKAQSAFPLGQRARKHTLLDPEETWTVPATVKLPKVPFSLRRLAPKDMEFLLGTRARTFVNQ